LQPYFGLQEEPKSSTPANKIVNKLSPASFIFFDLCFATV
jgi:hypothetical protein